MGDIQTISCGHDHNNDFFGNYYNVTMMYGRKTGYGGYGPPPGTSLIYCLILVLILFVRNNRLVERSQSHWNYWRSVQVSLHLSLNNLTYSILFYLFYSILFCSVLLPFLFIDSIFFCIISPCSIETWIRQEDGSKVLIQPEHTPGTNQTFICCDAKGTVGRIGKNRYLHHLFIYIPISLI